MVAKVQYNALWLSDIHLGTKDCKAEFLLNLLNNSSAKTIYLVGDIVDIWALQRKVYWPESHNKLLQKLMHLSEQQCKLIYIPGNHDEILKPYYNRCFANIQIVNQAIHTTESGMKMLLIHGDQFDDEVCYGPLHSKIGDILYDFLLFMNRNFHRLRKLFGYPYWSLASYIKNKVPKAHQAIARYRCAVINAAKQAQVDGVICGHIHHPELTIQDDIIYCNDGDWVENCTFVAEQYNGDLCLMQWFDEDGSAHEITRLSLGNLVANAA